MGERLGVRLWRRYGCVVLDSRCAGAPGCPPSAMCEGGLRHQLIPNVLPPPVWTMEDVFVVFESPRNPIFVPVGAGITPAGANEYRPRGIRGRPVSETGPR